MSCCASMFGLLIIHRCLQLVSAFVCRLSNQHVVLWRAAFGLHGHDPHRVPKSLCGPRAVQVHQAHALFTCRVTTETRVSFSTLIFVHKIFTGKNQKGYGTSPRLKSRIMQLRFLSSSNINPQSTGPIFSTIFIMSD